MMFSCMAKDDEDLDYLWRLMKTYEEFYLDDYCNTEDQVKAVIRREWNHYFYAMRDTGEKIGFLCFQQVNAFSAILHLLFADGRLRGRESDVNGMCRLFMNLACVQVIRGFTPVDRRATIAWAKRNGWSIDGIMRAGVQRDGKLIDLVISSYRGE